MEITTKNISEELALIFCDELQDNYANPTQFKDYWVATNAHIVLMIPKDRMPEAPPCPLKIDRALSTAIPVTAKYEYTYNQILEKLSELESTPGYDYTYRECDECEGAGEIDCPCCNHTNDCDNCDGSGRIETSRKENGLREYNSNEYFQLINGFFNPNYINSIIKAMDLLGLKNEKIRVTHNEMTSPTIIEISDVKIAIMPRWPIELGPKRVRLA